MKNKRKLVSIMLSLVMIFSLITTAFAAEENYSITINNSIEGHTYEAYQIFTGDLAEKDNNPILSNIVWGSGVTEAGQTALGNAASKVETLKNSEDAAIFAKEVVTYLNNDEVYTSTFTNGEYVISGLKAGYYLVKDENKSLDGKNDSYTSYILEIVENTTVKPKSDVPEVEKKVKDINDSTDIEMSEWQDSADHDIGDTINFQFTGTVPSNYDNYTVYKYTFHDTQSKGLTFNASSVEVFVDNVKITEGYTVITEGLDDGCTFEVSFSNLKDIQSVKAGSIIKVSYTSKLNENAVLGYTGNPNEVYLKFSNNPNDTTGEEMGKTPEDKVIVFTYKVVVNKITKNPDYDSNVEGSKEYIELNGAGFTLYKKDANTNEYVAIGEELIGEALTQFVWSGLDDGDYKLVETTTPAGYNTIEDIQFTITATHDIEADDPKLTVLSAGDLFSGEVSTGVVTADVINNAGTTLPETGGMGTTLFYVLGAGSVLTAIILLITKRRIKAEQ